MKPSPAKIAPVAVAVVVAAVVTVAAAVVVVATAAVVAAVAVAVVASVAVAAVAVPSATKRSLLLSDHSDFTPERGPDFPVPVWFSRAVDGACNELFSRRAC